MLEITTSAPLFDVRTGRDDALTVRLKQFFDSSSRVVLGFGEHSRQHELIGECPLHEHNFAVRISPETIAFSDNFLDANFDHALTIGTEGLPFDPRRSRSASAIHDRQG
jgi:hypothetical protein